MIATLHLADLGARDALRSLRHRPRPGSVAGLRWADAVVLAPLGTTRPPGLGRAGLVAFWDDEDAADAFTRTHPVGRRFEDGFHASLRPLRAFGAWPGLPADIPSDRTVPHDGPVAVITLGRLRLSQAVRFIRASRPAERAAVEASGLIWGTAAARPPFVATMSFWASGGAAATYAFGRQRPQHSDAIAAQRHKDFHRQSAFIRFAPLQAEGVLQGPNPLSAAMVEAVKA